ncbi:uncharacterized protein V6R79_016789 [Siganus canaliculatus]
MQKNDRSRDDNQQDSVSDDSSDSPEPGPVTCMEPFLVRRLSCRTVQLPPLAFRQAEQYYCDRKPEPDTVTVPPRPTTLPLRTPPLIAITSADTSSGCQHLIFVEPGCNEYAVDCDTEALKGM